MNKRMECAAVGVLLAAGTLSGCGGGDEAPKPATTTAPTATALNPNDALQAAYDAAPTKPQTGQTVSVFVQVDQADSDYANAEKTIKDGSINEFDLAFAIPNSHGILEKPTINPAVKNMLAKIGSKARIGLVIGGYSVNGSQEEMLRNWKAVSNNSASSKQFAKSTKNVVAELQDEGIEVDKYIVDWEWPTSGQKGDARMVLKDLRKENPGKQITYALQAEGAEVPAAALADVVDGFVPMAYDYNGAGWSKFADDASSGIRAQQAYREAAKAGKLVSLGIANHCQFFPGATGKGSKFTPTTSESVRQFNIIPPTAVEDDAKTLTSHAKVDGGWASCNSPYIKQLTVNQLSKALSETGLVDVSLWDLKGLTGADLAAVETPIKTP